MIPAEMRKALKVADDDLMTVKLNENKTLTVAPTEKRCGICNTNENLTESDDIILCQECIEKLKTIL